MTLKREIPRAIYAQSRVASWTLHVMKKILSDSGGAAVRMNTI